MCLGRPVKKNKCRVSLFRVTQTFTMNIQSYQSRISAKNNLIWNACLLIKWARRKCRSHLDTFSHDITWSDDICRYAFKWMWVFSVCVVSRFFWHFANAIPPHPLLLLSPPPSFIFFFFFFFFPFIFQPSTVSRCCIIYSMVLCRHRLKFDT